MLKPSDVMLPTQNPVHDEMDTIELIVDRALRVAGKSRSWPCEIGRPRTPLSPEAITHMGMRYGEYWDVEIEPHGTMLLYRISPQAKQ